MRRGETTEDARNEAVPGLETTLIGVSISAELYARASAICVLRKCTLEAVIEELIQKYLPRPIVDEPQEARVSAKPQAEPVKRRRRMPWRRSVSSDPVKA